MNDETMQRLRETIQQAFKQSTYQNIDGDAKYWSASGEYNEQATNKFFPQGWFDEKFMPQLEALLPQLLATEIERAEVEALKKLNKSRKLMQTPYKPGTVKSGIYQQGAQDAHKVWHEQIDEILQSKTGGDNANRSDT